MAKRSKETEEKRKATLEKNEKKLFDYAGYEIRMDARNYITIRDGEYGYYPTIESMLWGLRREMGREGLKTKEADDLAEIATIFKKIDEDFYEEIKKILKINLIK